MILHGTRRKLSRTYRKVRFGGPETYWLVQSVPEPLRRSAVKRICYSRRHRFFYMRVPKAANSVVTQTLFCHMPEMPHDRDDPSGRFAKKALRGMPSVAQFERSYRFTFVRDPASRVLSAWLDKGHNPVGLARRGGFEVGDPRLPTTFPEFLRALDDGLLERNLHWAPISSVLPFKGEGYDFIGRVESLEEDLEQVCWRLFGRFDGLATVRRRVTHAAEKVSHVVGPEERAIIHRLYEEDYERFYPDARG